MHVSNINSNHYYLYIHMHTRHMYTSHSDLQEKSEDAEALFIDVYKDTGFG